MTTTGYTIAKSFKAAADGMPKAAQIGVIKAAAIMEASVSVASGKYAGKKITKTRTVLLPPVGAEVKMVSRKAHLLDHDTKAHPIVPKSKPFLVFKDTGGAGGAHKRANGLVFALSVKHPGTKGKFMWEKALVAATPKMEQAMADSVTNHVLKSFGV